MTRYLKTKCNVRPLGGEGKVVLAPGSQVIDLAYDPSHREWHLYAVGPEGLACFVVQRKPRLVPEGEP